MEPTLSSGSDPRRGLPDNDNRACRLSSERQSVEVASELQETMEMRRPKSLVTKAGTGHHGSKIV